MSTLATFDDSPFFEKALRFGVQQGVISQQKLDAIQLEAPKGMVQIATAFGSPYLRAEIELARQRIVNLVSLYLTDASQGDVEVAARLIRDHTFLTLSRGGSTLLKELFALPEYAVLGPMEQGRVEDFLEFWSRKTSYQDYQQIRQQRLQYQLEIQLAKKICGMLKLPSSTFHDQHCEADNLIRSALLMAMKKSTAKKKLHCFDQIEFAELLDTLRKKGLSKTVQLDLQLSEDEQCILDHLKQDIITNDVPQITNKKIPLDNLVNQLKNRYFIRVHDIEDTANYDALVSKEWTKFTKGKHDIDAILTMLLCIAAKLPGKVSLTPTTAKSLVRKVRKEGFYPELASQFIQRHAPFEKQESLLEDWADFSEQAEVCLLDEDDGDFYGALHFLQENCYVEEVTKTR